MYAVHLADKYRMLSGYKLESPRTFFVQLAARPVPGDKKSEHTAMERRYLRCEAAQQNGFENVPIFGVMLLAGIVAQLPGGFMNAMAATYLALRVIFNLVYIFVENPKLATVRSMAYLGTVAIYMTVLIKAALAVAAKGL